MFPVDPNCPPRKQEAWYRQQHAGGCTWSRIRSSDRAGTIDRVVWDCSPTCPYYMPHPPNCRCVIVPSLTRRPLTAEDLIDRPPAWATAAGSTTTGPEERL